MPARIDGGRTEGLAERERGGRGNGQGRDGRSGVVAVAGLQGAGGQRVDVVAPDWRGHVHRHRTGAVGRDRASRQGHRRAAAVAVTAPPQVVLALGACATTTTPLGKVSMSGAVRLAAVAFGLLKVMVRVETPPALMVAGLKALPSVGATPAGALTVKVATAGAALLPLLVCKAPAASELK